MQICYESNLQCKFTTLSNDYKIAICLVYIFNVFQTIYIRLSVSVSQIIQIFKCKVNIKCCIFNNMQSHHIHFLLSTSTVVQEHIIAVFFPYLSNHYTKCEPVCYYFNIFQFSLQELLSVF